MYSYIILVAASLASGRWKSQGFTDLHSRLPGFNLMLRGFCSLGASTLYGCCMWEGWVEFMSWLSSYLGPRVAGLVWAPLNSKP